MGISVAQFHLWSRFTISTSARGMLYKAVNCAAAGILTKKGMGASR